MPLVSIIIPVYNCESYAKESIESILNQTFKDFEVILIDDGSSDSTPRILQSFKDPRINLITRKTNKGYVSGLNEGIQMARGEFIARMDADDYSFPTRLEEQVKFLKENPDCGIVGSFVTDFQNRPIINAPLSSEEIYLEFLSRNPFVHSSVMFRSKILIDNNLIYDEKLEYAEDYKLWFEICKHSRPAFIPKTLVKYRKHEAQVSYQYFDSQKRKSLSIRLSIWEYFLGRPLDKNESIAISRPIDSPRIIIKLFDEILLKNSEVNSFLDFLIRFNRDQLRLTGLNRFIYLKFVNLNIFQRLKLVYG
ncbi:hypothetical protein Aoki45_33250 [Algoriphagus sp. oki45]|uniref:glycosyltransferase family 2 protein n=1 Tax=Algoriphagus sp. oki45 TaxID=3067294 RepID=UPI0027E9E48C|nr:hypothetical protein Aoki45_33250 [Algoriphagus sp. oki45]